MKKCVSLATALTLLLILTACGRTETMTLPETGKIASVDVTAGDQTVRHTDEAWISEMVTTFSGAEPTGRESVQDVPQAEEFIRLDLQLGSGASTLFAYQEGGSFYVEQPYQGIWRITGEQYTWLGRRSDLPVPALV